MGCTQDPQEPILVRADIWPITKFVKNSDLENLLNIGMKREKFPMLTAVTNGLDTIISIRFSTKSRFIFYIELSFNPIIVKRKKIRF